ncbi:MAG: hotdog fold domain-containing protein [Longimicrobiales bacterium]
MTQPTGSAAVAGRLLGSWTKLKGVPGGRWMFSRMLGRMIPYTGSLGARVLHLERGYARVGLRDRRAVRNHLGSIHAAALTNLGELASGLALMTAAPDTVRGIPIRLTTDFLKKARGTLIAESRASFPVVTEPIEHEAVAEIRDESGDVVARVTALWKVSPIDAYPHQM